MLRALAAHAETGDALCDPALSTPASCVVTGAHTLPEPVDLVFSAPDVQITGTITAEPGGRCAAAGAVCTSDAECAGDDRCQRTANLALTTPGSLTLGRRGALVASIMAVPGDRSGPAGGTITLSAGSILVQGSLRAAATRASGAPPPGIPPAPTAGVGGRIAIQAAQSFALDDAGLLDASSSGGCGGRIEIGSPITNTVLLAGSLVVTAATNAGDVVVRASGPVTLAGLLDASNTSGNENRPVCPITSDAGGGDVQLDGGRIAILQKGQIRASGKEGNGGSVTLRAAGEVLVDSIRPTVLDLFGGNGTAIATGGELAITADGGDVIVAHGAIDLGGSGRSDAGSFTIDARGRSRCEASGTSCSRASDCAPDDRCTAIGGGVRVDTPITARGGTGAGFGCFLCGISATGAITLAGPIDVGGGNSTGQGGSLEISAGGDVTLGPGTFNSSGADGDELVVRAGAPTSSGAETGGTLRVLDGTQIRADGVAADGISGFVHLLGCDIDIGRDVRMTSVGGVDGSGLAVTIEARETLRVGDGVTIVSNPFGDVVLHHRTTLALAPTAVLEADTVDVSQTPDATPCARCGNGRVEPVEACDGPGSCTAPGAVCVPPGTVDACTCQNTCGTVPGIQPGERCDGTELGDATCLSQGFAGGTLACAADCTFDVSGCLLSVCGDGLVSGGERCDPGGIGDADPDLAGHNCNEEGFAGGNLICGPGCDLVVEPHCSLTVVRGCHLAEECPSGETCVGGCYDCGNGFLDPGEECDAGSDNSDTAPDACRRDCRLAHCGDGAIDTGEACDDGAENGDDRPCTSTCHDATCGDGLVCSAATCRSGPADGPEQCDDANTVPGDVCGTEAGGPCARANCGNGAIDPGEECDDGNTRNGDTCDANCTRPRCGNGVVGAGESCDDATACCVGCQAATCDDTDPCTTSRCDATIGCVAEPAAGRTCDDHDACTTDDRCDAAGSCVGTTLPCTTTGVCSVAICSPESGCTVHPLGGFPGLGCLPLQDLRTGIRGLGGAIRRPQLRRLLTTTRSIASHLAKARRRGPTAGGRRQVTLAAAATTRLRTRLALLRAAGVEEQLVDAASLPAGAIAAALDALLTS